MSAEAVELLQARLIEIAEEEDRLRRVVGILGTAAPGSSSPGRRREARSKPVPPKPKGKRAGHGERRTQLLAAIKKAPGASARELADLTGIGPTYVYGLVNKLKDAGEIKKSGKGFEIVS